MEKINESWNALFKITIPNAEFERVRNDPAFHNVLTLARHINQLAYCYSTLPKTKDKSPGSVLKVFNAMIFAGGALHEALRNIDPDNKSSYTRWLGNSFEDFWLDEEVKQFWKDEFFSSGTLRNSIAFHVSPGIFKSTLKDFDLGEYVFYEAKDHYLDQSYFSLADQIVFHFMGKGTSTDAEAFERQTLILSRVIAVTFKFVKAANVVISEYCRDHGWQNIETENSTLC